MTPLVAAMTYINLDLESACDECLQDLLPETEMIRKILIAHDLSGRSSIALKRAAQLAGQTGAALDILHVIEDDLPAAVIDRRTAEAKAVMSDELSALPELAKAKTEPIVVAGKDYTDI